MKCMGIALGCIGLGLVCFWFYNIIDSLKDINEFEAMMKKYEKWSV